MWDELRVELEARALAGRGRALRGVPGGVLDIAANDYLGLARHTAVVEGARAAASEFGAGARASRLVSGNFALVEELERELARFKGAEAALVFSSGFAANVGVLGALAGRDTALFCHKRNHASLLDGCRLAQSKGAAVRFWESPDKLALLLRGATAGRKIVVADGVFSMDGDLLPLPQVLSLCETYDAVLLLDDAHGTGVMGRAGRGTAEHFARSRESSTRSGESSARSGEPSARLGEPSARLGEPSAQPGEPSARLSERFGRVSERLLTVGTLSKSLGSQGGFVCGPRVAIDYLVGAAGSFIYSTGLNPPAVGAALAALRVLQSEPERAARCRDHARTLAGALCALGFDARWAGSAIVPVVVGQERAALELSARLEARGVWCPAIRPPTVARGTARLRIAASSEWTEEDVARIVAGFASE